MAGMRSWSFRRTLVFWWILFLVIQQTERLFLLPQALSLETEFGRQPKQALNEPRPLDLDLISFRQETRNSERLTLPHPRAHLRRFVLQPLSEIAADLVLPGQVLNVRQLLETLDSSERLLRLG